MSELVSCGPLEFRCGLGNCIPISQACDGNRDCVDGADEQPQACCTLSKMAFLLTYQYIADTEYIVSYGLALTV